MVGHSYPAGIHDEMASNGSYSTLHFQKNSRQSPYQPSSAPRSSVPQIPGKDDLEKLENLKRIIKSGQHEFYRAIPQPEALAKLYMGVLPSSMPEDIEDGQSKGQTKPDTSSTGPTSPMDSSRRPPRYQNKESTDLTPRKPSISNGSSQNGLAAQGSPNVQSGQGSGDTTASDGLVVAPNHVASYADPSAMDVAPDHRNHDSVQGGASATSGTPSAKPPGLPVKPDVPQPPVERARADSTAGRLPASLPEKPSVDVRVGPGRPAPPSNSWQGRGDTSRPEIYDRPPATQGAPSHGPPRVGSDNRSGPLPSEPYGQDSRDFRDRNRNWTERKPHDRYPRNAERPFDPSLKAGPHVKTEEVAISLSDIEHRPPSGPSDSRPTFVNGRDAHEFPQANESQAANDSLQQPVPGLSADVDSQAHSLSSSAPLRRESYPPPQDFPLKTDSTDRPNDQPFGKLPQVNGGPSEGPAQNHSNNEKYPPRASSPTVKQQPRDDVRGVPPKVAPSPNSNQTRHSGPRDYNRGPPGENGPRPYRPPPNNYRPDYGDTRRTDRMDVDEPRYMERSYRTYSPPPDRARGIPPSPGRPGASDYDDPRRYSGVPPPPGSLAGREWYGGAPPPASGYPAQPQRWEDDPYYKSRSSHWDPSLERDRYERDPVRGTWDARTDRDPRAYARGPPVAPPIDDRYPPSRDLDRTARPPPPSNTPLPPYSRTRPRSPSPIRRGVGPMAVDDPRPPLKRSRDDYGPPQHHAPPPPAGGDYYSPRNPDMRNRPPPGSDSYSNAPPPGPPPSSGGSNSFYDRSGPPPPSSSTMNSDRDRDYMRRDVGGMDYAPPPQPPQHAGYGRPRSPPPPPGARLGSAPGPYDNRSPYSRGPPPPNGRDRPYGIPPTRP
ncbi:hypothetical protein BKA70DRAFT_409824 [Coprinopsis sp. MPI-PUGE-AT-0042]|nr:hypothetical protein BKA70DRAFT_409824 [Coprinopsis sp. MPI-PUGE-AT-0042]